MIRRNSIQFISISNKLTQMLKIFKKIIKTEKKSYSRSLHPKSEHYDNIIIYWSKKKWCLNEKKISIIWFYVSIIWKWNIYTYLNYQMKKNTYLYIKKIHNIFFLFLFSVKFPPPPLFWFGPHNSSMNYQILILFIRKM